MFINLDQNKLVSSRGLSNQSANNDTEPTIHLPTRPTAPKGKYIFSLSPAAADLLNLKRDGLDNVLFYMSEDNKLAIINDSNLAAENTLRVNKSLNISNKPVAEALFAAGYQEGQRLMIERIDSNEFENVVVAVVTSSYEEVQVEDDATPDEFI